MSVSASVTLPAQPTIGVTQYVPLGGDGKFSPLGCYFCRVEVVGDAGGGNASLIINFDTRYTTLVAYLNLQVAVAAAAPDFSLILRDVSNGNVQQEIGGTAPHIATGIVTNNATFLWYPPPVYYQQAGLATLTMVNVAATETYKLSLEAYVFDKDIRRLTPLPFLQQNVPGVSAPAAI